MSDHAIDVTQQTFEHDVLAASFQQPVLVDFWAPWCGPCRTLKPLLEKLADEYQGRFRLAKINSDENQQVAAHYQVRSIPCVKAFVDGELIDEFTGALPEGQLKEFIDRLLPSPADALRTEAAALRANGRPDEALDRLAKGSQIDPNNEGVRLDTAELLISLGRRDEAQPLLAMNYEQENNRAQAIRAQLDIAASAMDAIQLRARLERIRDNPDDHAGRIELAKAMAALQRYEESLDQLLETIHRDKTFNQGEARLTMLQLFELLSHQPEGDELVRRYRRMLASALH